MSRNLATREDTKMVNKPPPGDGNGGDSGETPDDPITRCLRLVYSEVEAEPLSDELARLLRELQDKEGAPDG
jgi:hypothetical protein